MPSLFSHIFTLDKISRIRILCRKSTLRDKEGEGSRDTAGTHQPALCTFVTQWLSFHQTLLLWGSPFSSKQKTKFGARHWARSLGSGADPHAAETLPELMSQLPACAESPDHRGFLAGKRGCSLRKASYEGIKAHPIPQGPKDPVRGQTTEGHSRALSVCHLKLGPSGLTVAK